MKEYITFEVTPTGRYSVKEPLDPFFYALYNTFELHISLIIFKNKTLYDWVYNDQDTDFLAELVYISKMDECIRIYNISSTAYGQDMFWVFDLYRYPYIEIYKTNFAQFVQESKRLYFSKIKTMLLVKDGDNNGVVSVYFVTDPHEIEKYQALGCAHVAQSYPLPPDEDDGVTQYVILQFYPTFEYAYSYHVIEPMDHAFTALCNALQVHLALVQNHEQTLIDWLENSTIPAYDGGTVYFLKQDQEVRLYDTSESMDGHNSDNLSYVDVTYDNFKQLMTRWITLHKLGQQRMLLVKTEYEDGRNFIYFVPQELTEDMFDAPGFQHQGLQ